MDITLGELQRLPIKRLKAILAKLLKEPKTDPVTSMIEIVKNLIREKKKKGTILHHEFVKNGKVFTTENKAKPIHLRN